MLFVSFSGLVIAAQQPLETFGELIQRIREVWRPGTAPAVVGSMVAHQSPGLLLIRQECDDEIQPGVCLLIADKHAPLRIGVALGYFGRDEGLLLRALEIEIPERCRPPLLELGRAIPEACVSILADNKLDTFRDDVYLLKYLDSFVGIVAPDTATERLYFEVIQERDIEQGRLVETFVGGKRVLYQVLDGLTKEEIVQQKNTYGFARGEASQVGAWDDAARKFKPCSWIPRLNAPVLVKTIEVRQDNKNAVGHFPSTSYHVEIKSLDEIIGVRLKNDGHEDNACQI